MGVIVSFVYADWLTRYPEFSAIPQSTVTDYFTQAQVIHRNDGGGPVSTAATQTYLLYLVVAHLAFLFGGVSGASAPQAVGRVVNASQGSVSAQLDYGTVTNSQAWWVQSKYGAQYWVSIAPYRTMRYMGGLRGGGVFGRCGPLGPRF